MEVTDSNRARFALGLLGAASLAGAGVMLVNAGAVQLLMRFGTAVDVWFTATQAFWVLTGAVEVWAFYELSRAVKPQTLVHVALGAAGVALLSSLFWLVLELRPHDDRVHVPAAVHVALIVAGLGGLLASCFIVASGTALKASSVGANTV